MKNEVFVLLENALPTTEVVTEKMIGSGYHNNDGAHTVSYVFNNFIGFIVLQGTLEIDPDNFTDWADISATKVPVIKKEFEYQQEYQQNEYQQNEYQQEYQQNEYEYEQKIITEPMPISGSVYYNFFGNFVWIRAKYRIDAGSINRVVFNF